MGKTLPVFLSLLFALVFLSTYNPVYAQDCNTIGSPAGAPSIFNNFENPIDNCSGSAEVNWTFGWRLSAAEAANCKIEINWDDGTIERIDLTNISFNTAYYGIVDRKHTYDYDNGSAAPSGNNIDAAQQSCTYLPKVTLVVNGTVCLISAEGNRVTVWDTEDNALLNSIAEEDARNGGSGLFNSPAGGDYDMCAGNTNAHFLADLTVWNCTTNPQEDLNPNTHGRWVQYVYGETNGVTGGNVTVGGVPMTGVYYGPVTWIANSTDPGGETLPIRFPANAGANECFSVRLRSWNVCNPYGAAGSEVPVGSFNENDFAWQEDPVDLWTRTICTVEAPNPPLAADLKICVGGDPTLRANGQAGAVIRWYEEDPTLSAVALTPVRTGANFDPANPDRTLSDPFNPNPGSVKTYTYWVTQAYDAGAGEDCESLPREVILTIYPEVKNNTINDDQELCYTNQTGNRIDPALITGSTPTGGDGSYVYQWQQRYNGGAWSDIGGANDVNYDPPVLDNTTDNAVTYSFRRIVSSGDCDNGGTPGNECVNNLCESISAEVDIIVHPRMRSNNIRFDHNDQSVIELCANTSPGDLKGAEIKGGRGNITYTWTRSKDGAAPVVVSNNRNYNNSPDLTPGVYEFVRIAKDECDAVLTSNTITAHVRPVVPTPAAYIEIQSTNVGQTAKICFEEPFTFVVSGAKRSFTVNGEERLIEYRPYDLASGNYGKTWTVPASEGANISFVYGAEDRDRKFSIRARFVEDDDFASKCEEESAELNIIVNPEVLIDAGADQLLCNGETITLDGTASGGTENLEYRWTGPKGFAQTGNPVNVPNGQYPDLNIDNVYQLTITDKGFNHSVGGASCQMVEDITVKVYENPSASVDVAAQTICPGFPVEMVSTINKGDNGNLTFEWSWDREGDFPISDYLFTTNGGNGQGATTMETPFFIPDGNLNGSFIFTLTVTETHADGHFCTVATVSEEIIIDPDAPKGTILTFADQSGVSIPAGLLNGDGTAFDNSCATDEFYYVGTEAYWKNDIPGSNYDEVYFSVINKVTSAVLVAEHQLAGNTFNNNNSQSSSYKFDQEGEFVVRMRLRNSNNSGECSEAIVNKTIHVLPLPDIEVLSFSPICQGITIDFEENTAWGNLSPIHYSWEIKNKANNTVVAVVPGNNAGADNEASYQYNNFGVFEVRVIVEATSPNGISCHYSKVVGEQVVDESPIVSSDLVTGDFIDACGAFELDLKQMATDINLTYTGQKEILWSLKSANGKYKLDDDGNESPVVSSKHFENFYVPSVNDEDKDIILEFHAKNLDNQPACQVATIEIPVHVYPTPAVNPIVDERFCYDAQVLLNAERTDVNANTDDFDWVLLSDDTNKFGTIAGNQYTPNTAFTDSVHAHLRVFPTNVVAVCDVDVQANFGETVEVQHNAKIEIAGLVSDVNICSNVNEQFRAEVSGGNKSYTYDWFLNNITESNPSEIYNFQKEVIFADARETYDLKFFVKDNFISTVGDECYAEFNIDITALALPQIKADDNLDVCYGDDITVGSEVNLPADGRALAEVRWSEFTGGNFVQKATGLVIDKNHADYAAIYPDTPPYPTSREKTLFAQVEDEYGCVSPLRSDIATITQKVKVNAVPEMPLLSGEESFCMDSGLKPNFVYAFNNGVYSPDYSYEYSISPDDPAKVIYSEITIAKAFFVEYQDAGVFDLELQIKQNYSSGLVCASPVAQKQIVVNPEPIEHNIISDKDKFCQWEQIPFKISPYITDDYVYEWVASFDYIIENGATGDEKLLTFSNTGLIDILVNVKTIQKDGSGNILVDGSGNPITGCTVLVKRQVEVTPSPVFETTLAESKICSDTQIDLLVSSSEGYDYSYGFSATNVTGGSSGTHNNETNFLITDELSHTEVTVEEGFYDIIATEITGDAYKCQTEKQVRVEVVPSISTPTIAIAPVDICDGARDVTIEADITEGSAYYWQFSMDDGATFESILDFDDGNGNSWATYFANIDKPTLEIRNAVYEVLNDVQFRLEIQGCKGIETSNIVTLNIKPRTEIIKDPQNQEICEDVSVQLFIEIEPYDPSNPPRIQWQRYDSSQRAWVDLPEGSDFSGTNTLTLTIETPFVVYENNNANFRAMIQGECDDDWKRSENAVLTINKKPSLRVPLVSQTVCNAYGEKAEFFADALNTFLPTYQWEVSTDGGLTWTDIDVTNPDYEGADEEVLLVKNVSNKDGFRYSVVIGSASNTCNSTARPEPGEEATLTVLPLPEAFEQTYEVCSDDAGGEISTINLTAYDEDVKGTNDAAIIVKWFLDDTYQTEVSNKFAHPVRDQDQVYPLVVNGQACENGTKVTFDLITRPGIAADMITQYQVCAGTQLLISPTAETGQGAEVFQWELVRNANIDGLPVADSGTGDFDFVLANSTTFDQGLEIIFTAANSIDGSASCVSKPVAVTATVYPTPVVELENNRADICDEGTTAVLVKTPITPANNSYFTFTKDGVPQVDENGDVIELTNYSSIAQVLENTTQAPINFEFEVTPWRVGCSTPGLSATTTVKVNPTPIAQLTVDKTEICSGDDVVVNMTSDTELLPDFKMVYTYTSESENGFGTILGSGVQNSFAVADQYSFSGELGNKTSEPQKMVYTVTPSVQGCDNNKVLSVSKEVIVRPVPVISLKNEVEILCNNGTTDIMVSSPNVTNAYLPTSKVSLKGTAVASSADVTGFTSNIDIEFIGGEVHINDVLVNASNEVQTVTYNLAPYFDDCSGEAKATVVEVYPTMQVAVDNQQPIICSESRTAFELSSTTNVAGLKISYRAECPDPNVLGYSNFERFGQPGDIVAEQLTNLTSSPKTVTYFFKTMTENGSCQGETIEKKVVVWPSLIFDVTAVTDRICNEEEGTFKMNTAVTALAGYQVKFDYQKVDNSNVSGASSGTQAVDGAGELIVTDQLVNSSTTVQEQVYRIALLITKDGAELCRSEEKEVAIFVRPTLYVTALDDMEVCPDNLVIVPPFSGAETYTWTNTDTSIGLGENGQRNIPAFTSINETALDVIAQITVIGSNQGCYTAPMSFNIKVKPTPEKPEISGQLVYCQEEPLAALEATGTDIKWYSSSYLGASSLIGAGNTFTPDAEDVDTQYAGTYTIYATQTVNGCESEAVEVTFTVNPKPLLAFNLLPTSDCTPLQVKLVNASQGHDPAKDHWVYQIAGDPSTQAPLVWDEEGQFIFQNKSGALISYEVIYTATTDLNCSREEVATIEVNPELEFEFNIIGPDNHPEPSCSGTEYTFRRQNLGNTDKIDGLVYTWSFGDGSSVVTDDLEVKHIYENPSYANIRNYRVSLTVSAPFCQSVQEQEIKIYPQILSNIELLDNVGCAPLNVKFLNNSRGYAPELGVYQKRIQGTDDWIDFEVADDQAIFDNITQAVEIWEVRYLAKNEFGCPDISQSKLITVTPRPVSQFVNDALLCEGAPANFDASTSIGDIESYRWDMGDNTLNQYGETLEYTYKEAGYYTITLETTNSFGCTDLSTSEIQLQISPTVSIAAGGPKAFCEGLDVNLTSEVAEAVTYQWLKDEEEIAGETADQITVNTSGIYSLKVTQVAGVGCSRISDSLKIRVYPLPEVELVRNKEGKILCPGEEVLFTADADLNIQTFLFHVSGEEFTANQDRNSFVYSRINDQDEVYAEAITFTGGCVGVSPVLIQQVDMLNPNFEVVGEAVSCSPFVSRFKIEAFNPALVYTWDFGDGTIEVLDTEEVTHTYTNSSPFLQSRHAIKLTVSNPVTECSASSSQDIRVNPTPVVDFNLTSTEGCAPFRASAENESKLVNKTEGDTYTWTVKNVLTDEVVFTSNLENPFLELQNNTTEDIMFEVLLVANDAFGCTDRSSQLITVYPQVVSSFYVDAKDNTQLWPDNEFNIVNTTYNGEVPEHWTYRWVVAGQEAHVGPQIGAVKFDKPGVYNITLMVATEHCNAEVTQLVNLQSTNPIVDFIADPKVGCAPVDVNFTNTSRNVDEFTKYRWEFGDGNFSEDESPKHQYENPGTYYVSLQATNSITDGAYFKRDTIVVYPSPTVNFRVDRERVFLPDADIQIVNFTTGSNNIYDIDWGDGTSGEDVPSDVKHSYSKAGDFFITLSATNEFGCVGSATIKQPVEIREGGKVETPNAFQPSQDGPNSGNISETSSKDRNYSVFAPYAPNVVEEGYKLEVYTRWGQLIFQTEKKGIGWNGYYFNSGDALPAGVYIFKLSARTVDGNRVSKVGDVTLLK